MQHNEYDVKVIKVVDGDTVDVDIDLVFYQKSLMSNLTLIIGQLP